MLRRATVEALLIGRMLGVAVFCFVVACQESKQPSASRQAKHPTEEEKAQREWEEAKLLSVRCVSLKRQIPHLPLQLRKDMAFLLSEADASFSAVYARVSHPELRGFNPNAGRQMLDDAHLFLDQVQKCIGATKRRQRCQFDTEVGGMLRDALEEEKDGTLRELSNYCN